MKNYNNKKTPCQAWLVYRMVFHFESCASTYSTFGRYWVTKK